MGSGNSHFGERAAVGHSMRLFHFSFGECTEGADSKRSCEAERAGYEALYLRLSVRRTWDVVDQLSCGYWIFS